ncbi:C40 family peptidase [Dermatophilaceae bacterium Soc4.6]
MTPTQRVLPPSPHQAGVTGRVTRAARVRRVLVASITGGLVVTVTVGGLVGPLARADQPAPVFPSADQVAAARAAVGGAAAQVAAIDGQLAASRAAVAELSQNAADAMEAASGARLALDAATARAATAVRASVTAQRASDDAQLTLSRLAAEVYQSGGGDTSQLDVFFGGGGPQAVLDRAAGVDAVGSERARLVQEAGATSHLAQSARQEAAEAEQRRAVAAAAASAAADEARRQAEVARTTTIRLETRDRLLTAQLATLQKTSVALEQQRQAGLAAQEQRRREEANRRAALARAAAQARQAAAQASAAQAAAAAAERSARTARERAAAQAAARAAAEAARQAALHPASSGSSGSSGSGGSSSSGGSGSGGGPRMPPVVPRPTPPPPPPAPTGGVSAVLAYARAQLGKPYVWGAQGPSSFDCSGLTLMAWRQAGVSLLHYTGYQYSATARVPISALQPGDLVFYGTSGESSHHVGLYIGGGMMIHAPNPSTVVKISSIYSMSDLLPYGGRP